jgi:hypothetical protein
VRARFLLPLTLLLNACLPASEPDVASLAKIAESSLPPAKSFAARVPARPAQPNAEIARDFLDLTFQLESGRQLPVFTRFEGPITVRTTGNTPAHTDRDLDKLLLRLRNEANIPITRTTRRDASVTVQSVSRRDIRGVLPRAACFVAPNVGSLKEYRAGRRQSRTDWTALTKRERIAVFLPHDASPQEVRDCLHEELAQAIGPLNDLYRLSDSVFNDDNVHNVLTGFDMLILRAYYHPALRSGMSRAQVAAALPGILARLNPSGNRPASRAAFGTSRRWSAAIQTALGHTEPASERQNAAREAIALARRAGWPDHRLAFSHYAMGRALQGSDPETAYSYYIAADRAYGARPETELHRAYVGTRLAAYAISRGDGEEALRQIVPYLDVARRNENAALLATLLLLQAEALELSGRPEEARSVRLDSLGWARYGFGPDWAVRAKLNEISSLNPHKG